MTGPTASFIDHDPNGRLHLQHGPIDLIIGVDGAISLELEAYFRAHAFAHANRRFRTVLDELVAELPVLKSQALTGGAMPQGQIAMRMMTAVLPFAETAFITPMAAVAGAVADEILAAMLASFDGQERPRRIYVNNGGDIALHLDDQADFRIRMAREDGAHLGDFAVDAASPTRGIATSGRGGRSLSMGIADSVTVLASNAAAADAAATIVANAVDLPGHAAVRRLPANRVVDDSDLGARLVTVDCGDLSDAEVTAALDAGGARAQGLMAEGLMHRAGLFLKAQGHLVTADLETIAMPARAGTLLESRRYA